jgi:hypothetical protein
MAKEGIFYRHVFGMKNKQRTRKKSIGAGATMEFFFDENGYVALIGVLASQNQKVTNLKKVGDL